MKRFVEEVFVTEGVPVFNFVEPSNFNDIYLDIRKPGKPVVIEGQSGTGKTTCIMKIIEKIEATLKPKYIRSRLPESISEVVSLLSTKASGLYIIDDFHRLQKEYQEKLADMAKTAAEQQAGEDYPKLVLIGINQVGSSLIQMVPDIAKRTGIHRILPGDEDSILRLVKKGCAELLIDIKNDKVIFQECRGDYWLAQQLCQSICVMNDVLETVDSVQEIYFDIDLLRKKVVERLNSSYYLAVKEFCRGKRFRSTNDPYYKLLKAVGEQDSSVVDINELANSRPDIRGSINNIKEKRLTTLLGSSSTCYQHFYYNRDTKYFAIEDPAIFYFLKHLDWDRLRRDCGFRDTGKDYEYDFAISFAGENRELAKEISEQLEVFDTRVFIDENYEANFLGKAWHAQFELIFSNTSRLVICLLDQYYKAKIWPTFESECFLPRVADGDVIPIFLDESIFPGIPHDIIGVKYSWDPSNDKWKDEITDKIVYKLMERIG
ncbi:TIR domain-containing protein [Desulfovibrio sp. JY]|nr:TIR domain-containing protein [Desulfovibrio sp. JY]